MLIENVRAHAPYRQNLASRDFIEAGWGREQFFAGCCRSAVEQVAFNLFIFMSFHSWQPPLKVRVHILGSNFFVVVLGAKNWKVDAIFVPA